MTARLSLAQAALRLGVTYHQVRALLFQKHLEGGEEGGRYYVDATDVDRLAKEWASQDRVDRREVHRATGGR